MSLGKQFDNTFPKQADRFANEVNAGGSSWSVSDGSFPKVGEEGGYMVGGHPDSNSVRVPEHIIDKPNDLTGAVPALRLRGHEAAAHFTKVALATAKNGVADPTAHAGGWLEQGKQIVLDASSRIDNVGEALDLGRKRNERAIFDIRNAEDVYTDNRNA